MISISIVAYAVLVPRVVAIAVEDAEELNQEPCTADPGASRAEYPLGVLIVVLVASPAKNISPSLELAPVRVAPVAAAAGAGGDR